MVVTADSDSIAVTAILSLISRYPRIIFTNPPKNAPVTNYNSENIKTYFNYPRVIFFGSNIIYLQGKVVVYSSFWLPQKQNNDDLGVLESIFVF